MFTLITNGAPDVTFDDYNEAYEAYCVAKDTYEEAEVFDNEMEITVLYFKKEVPVEA